LVAEALLRAADRAAATLATDHDRLAAATREAALALFRVSATDLEVGVRIRIPVDIDEADATTVPPRLLAGVVGELNQDRVTVALKENRLRIRAGRSSTTLRTMDADEFPPGPQPADGKAIMLPREELLTAIGQVRPAASFR